MQLYLSNRVPEYMADYAYFACGYLGIDKLRGEINLNTVTRYKNDPSCRGLCWGDDREIEIQIANRAYNQPLSRKEKLLTVGHELVHARQFLTRDLVADEHTKWKGKRFKHPKNEYNTPWEREARKLEKEIHKAWLKHINK